MTPPAVAVDAPSILAKPVYLCHCLKVSHDEVQEAILLNGCETVDDVTNSCGAGGGCTGCHRRIREYLAQRNC